jgi:hypothetical protein
VADLDGVRAKLERARDHAKSLNAKVLRFRRRHPYEVVHDRDRRTGEHLLRLLPVEQPPLQWAVEAGEVLHDLRSALDHLVYQLVGLNKDPPRGQLSPRSPWNALRFPICTGPADFWLAARRGLWGIDKPTRELIEAYQPYRRSQDDPANDPLWRLAALSDIDKHRPLHLVGAWIQAAEPPLVVVRGATLSDLHTRGPGAIDENAELARFCLAGPSRTVQIEHHFLFHVAFDEPGPLGGWDIDFVSALLAVADHAEEIAGSFASRFGDGAAITKTRSKARLNAR